MNEFTKSLIFAIVGSLLVGIATFVYFRSQPKEIDQFAMVGEEFFPDFTSPNDVRALDITAYDFETRKEKEFRVEYRDDQWVIASNYGYPAEAADRLDRTAASVLGIQREALAGRRANDHKRFGVVDPESEEADAVNRSDQDAVGVRITLEDRKGEPLVDYIIGKEVDRQNEEDAMLREIRGLDPALPLHYVRVPGEQETYVASIQVDVSTKFADWIEPDLLLLDAQELRKLVINDYSFEEKLEDVEIVPGSGIIQKVRRLEKVEGEAYTLTKPAGFGPWSLEGLNPETEQLDTSKVSSITGALDDFKIVGVAPRYKYQDQTILNANLELEFPDSIRTRGAAEQVIQEVAQDLQEKGFNLTQDQRSKKLAIAADQGELTAATSEGLVYHLYFGNELSGTEQEIELGTAGAAAEATTPSEDDAAAGENAADATDDANKNRYVLVRVAFDETMLGTPPVKPVKPEPPMASETDAKPEEQSGQDEATGKDNTSGGNAGTGNGNDDADQVDNEQRGPYAADADPVVISQEPAQDDTSGSPESKQDTEKQDAEKQDDAKQSNAKQDQDAKSDGQSAADSGQVQDDAPKSDDGKTASQDDNSSSSDPAGVDNGGQDEPVDPQAEYEQQLQAYEAQLAMYESQLQQFAQRKQLSEEKVRLLNERFQDWYYVISAENLETLTVSRSDLVKPKPPAEGAAPPAGGFPGGGNLPPTLTPPTLDNAVPQPPTQLPDAARGDDGAGDDGAGDDGAGDDDSGGGDPGKPNDAKDGDSKDSDPKDSDPKDGAPKDSDNQSGADQGSGDDSGSGDDKSGDQAGK